MSIINKTNLSSLVSIGIAVWNGELYLAETLESLIGQTYSNIEIIILDNLSTDRTSIISKSFESKDSRVKYILDECHRDVCAAQIKTAELARGEFFMVACDDDVYHPQYINTMIDILLANKKVGLAYSGWNWIFPDGTIKESKWKWFLHKQNSKFKNFSSYLFHRKPIPLVFGVIRIDIHRDALTYFYRPDKRGWDHDNLYLLRLLSMTRVDCIKKTLFFYRERDREVLYKGRGQFGERGSMIKAFRKVFLHQISVKKEITKIINNSNFGSAKKGILKLYSLHAFLYYALVYQIILKIYYTMVGLLRRLKS
jgi:glycosyltransferase involved in cell wall biosynthesis